MYRLLKIRRIASNNNYYVNTFQNNLKTSTMVCSFCRFSHPKTLTSSMNYSQYRYQTTINPALLNTPVRKKRKHKNKQFADVTEVSKNTVSNRKTPVTEVNAAHMDLLIHHPLLTLDKLHELETEIRNVRLDNSRSTQTFYPVDQVISNENVEILRMDKFPGTESSAIETMDAIDAMDRMTMTMDDQPEFYNSYSPNSSEDLEVLENKEKVKRKEAETSKKSVSQKKKKKKSEVVMKESEKNMRKNHIANSLSSFIQVCIDCRMKNKIFEALNVIRHQCKHIPLAERALNVTHYNILLRFLAKKADLKKMMTVMEWINLDSLKPLPQTYAAFFEAFGRMKIICDSDLELVKAMQKKMEKDGITFNNLVKEMKFIQNERKFLIKGIRIVDKNFEPIVEKPNYSYNCHLLNKIDFSKTGVVTSPAENLFTPEDLDKKFDEQLKHEIEGQLYVKSIATKDESPSDFASNIVAQLEKYWMEKGLEAFDRNLKTLKQSENCIKIHSLPLSPYLSVMDRKEYVKTIIENITAAMSGSETFSPTLGSLYCQIGSQINDKYQIMEKQRYGITNKLKTVYSEYSDWYLNRTDASNSRIAWENIVRRHEIDGSDLYALNLQWPGSINYRIGEFLYKIILKDIKFNVNCLKPNTKEVHYLPAFYVLYRQKSKYIVEEMKPHPVLWKMYRHTHLEKIKFPISLLPTICPSKPWVDYKNGAYLVSHAQFMRFYGLNMSMQDDNLEKVPTKQLWPALDVLNQLSSIPWRVNGDILDIAIQVFQNGGSVKLTIPQHPSSLPPLPNLQDFKDTNHANLLKKSLELRQRKAEMYSLWCDCLYKLSLSSHFRDTIFWLPHNMDFRGRVYPIPPHLTHLGNDLSRSLLTFALRKPLGPKGLDWLKIHVINLTGFKKRDSVSERLKYANENLDKILDSAERPLTGEMWWSKSDEQWQTLAACMEIANAIKSGDPENYMSGFPIHQDGSCNGLQHYAALGRDQIGAESVNLYPSEKPQDVYSTVVSLVEEQRAKNEASGDKLAKVLRGFIKRKIIKQTVMTTVYGVTKYGARLQIMRKLEDSEDFPKQYVWPASWYLAQSTFDSLKTMFTNAREIQDWFTKCAKCVTTYGGMSVQWVTPLGLPVIQPYFVSDKYTKKLHILNDRPNTLKQRNAFAPNFVHSLDSSHMMLTSLYCENIGLTFMSVHDCYWTHACTVDEMNKICRQQFVALHSEPILEQLSANFIQLCSTKPGLLMTKFEESSHTENKVYEILSSVPKKGSFRLEDVLKSTYFFG